MTADSAQTDEDTATAMVAVVQTPNFTITKEVTGIAGGYDNGTPLNPKDDIVNSKDDVISYKITVFNDGNVTLTPKTIADQLSASLGKTITLSAASESLTTDGFLQVGETWTYTASYTATAGDLDDANTLFNDTILNTVSASFLFGEQTITHEAMASTLIANVDLEKLVSVDGTTFIDADTADALSQNVSVAAPINFRITAQNTGSVDLTNVVITDVNGTVGGTQNGTVTLFQNGALTAAALAAGASLSGDDNDGVLEVGETWTINYKQAFEFGQHINTAFITDAQGATDNDAAYYFGIQSGPGVRTPGFWSNLGAQFWNNIQGDETKSGPTFAKGELIYAVDSNHDGVINASDQAGLLVGDYNRNGITDVDNPLTAINEAEDTFFIGLTDAKNLINASLKTQSGDGVQMLGRDVVATWLNYLAGNPIGDAGDSASPKHYINDAVNWLQTFGGTAGNGNPSILTDNVKTESFDSYFANHTAVKTSTAQWNTAQFAGDSHTAAGEHVALDYYNNTGQTSVGGTHYAMSADNPFDAMLIMASQSVTP